MKKKMIILTACLTVISLMNFSIQAKDMPELQNAKKQNAGEIAGSQIPDGGEVAYLDNVAHLSQEQEQVILDFMNLYYESLMTFDVSDPASLFAPDAQTEALRNQTVWDLTVQIRQMQGLDLRLKDYRYEITCLRVAAEKDGDIEVSANEDVFHTFAAYPDVQSANYNIEHVFTLTQTEEGWKIRQHLQIDGFNLLVDEMAPGEEEQVLAELEWMRYNVLVSAQESIEQLKEQQKAQAVQQSSAPYYEHEYDRNAAVDYGQSFVVSRNAGWPVYDNYGGNCMNFASQALYAGGIPMDYTGDAQWKWYGERHNRKEEPAGRTPAWSSVGDFYTYAMTNDGPGLVAGTGNYYTAQKGDLIQLGIVGRWRHTAVITDVIKDKNGNTIDYLVCSNTSDQFNYPASAYPYAMQRVILIYGWNEPLPPAEDSMDGQQELANT